MKVLKFGGTSLGNSQRIQSVARIVVKNENCFVVCSAMAGVTNALEETALAWKNGDTSVAETKLLAIRKGFEQTCYDLFDTHEKASEVLEVLNNHFDRTNKFFSNPFTELGHKTLLALGEIVTSSMFTSYLAGKGQNAHLVDALDILQLNDQDEPEPEDIQRKIQDLGLISQKGIYVTQGFICRNQAGEITNLKRGGSDYTATLLGAALGVSVIEIWTDIDGLHNNDPRVVPGTFPVRELSFAEASELAYFGAKILHPACVWPARKYNIPILLKNTMDPDALGTIIRSALTSGGIKAVAAKDNVTIIRIISGRMFNAYGFLKKVFEVFDDFRIPVDVVTTSEVSVSITIEDTTDLMPLLKELEKLGRVNIQEHQCIVCIVGDVLHQGHVADIMQRTKNFEIQMISLGASSNNITLVLPQEQKTEALTALNTIFTNPQNARPCLKTGS
jgi:aspartate kinase